MPGAWEVAAPAKPVPFVGSEGSSFTPAQIFARNAPYLKPGTANFWTKLNPKQESQFRSWVKDSHVEFDPNAKTPDYDMRGFWLALQRGDPRATGAIDPNDHKYHYPDYWKTPYDLTFSRESQWANKDAPQWNSKDQLVLPSGKVVFDDKHRTGYMKPQESKSGWEVAAAEKPAPLPAGPSPIHTGLEHIKSIYHSIEPGVKHNAKQLLGVFSSLADLATAVPGQVMTASAIAMEDLNQLLAGEEPKKAYKTGLETGEKVGGMFMNPVHRVLALLHQEKPYEASAPQKAMDKFNSKVHDIAVEYEGATGGKFPASAFEGIVQELFGILSAEGTTAGATRLVDKLDKISEAKGKVKAVTPPKEGGPAPEQVDKEFTDWAHGLAAEPTAIKEAALKDKETGQILPQGERHDIKLKATGKYHEGFLDQEGNFLDRKQAEERARATGQLKPEDKMFRPEEGLHSGDIFRKTKPRMKLRLTPKGAAMGLGAGAIALAAADPQYRKKLLDAGLIGGALLAVKEKGGMWHPEAVERLASSLKDTLVPGRMAARDLNIAMQAALERQAAGELTEGRNLANEEYAKTETGKIDAWTTRAVRNYLNRYAGTAEDPLKDVEIPAGPRTMRWEDATDKIFQGKWFDPSYPERTPGLREGEKMWKVNEGLGPSYPGRLEYLALTSYLSHVGDYLRQNVDPAKLQQYDLVRAVKETAKNDERVAKEMEKAAAASTKDLPVYKDYTHDNPGTLPGMKWVELKKPERLTEEQESHIESYKNKYIALDSQGKPIKNTYTGEEAEGKTPEEAHLAGQLAQEGNQMGHCVGGYCEGVASGESRIFSLRDAKGRSHVTIEVEPGRDIHDEALRSRVGEAAYESGRRFAAKDNILQIKGKQNRAPNPEYLPYVQDFVRSGNWGEVGDLQNTGLVDAAREQRLAEQHGDQAAADYYAKHADERYVPPYTKPVLKGQAGRISPEVLTGLASAGLGALAGAYVDDKNPIMGMIVGGTLGLWMVNGIRSMARGSADEAVAARSLMTNLTKLTGETMARQIMLIKYLKSHIPSDYLEHAKAIYAHLEDPSKPLSPRARELMDKYVKPVQKGNARIREALRKLGVDVGPDISGAYVHRIPKGQRSSIFEQLERAYPQHRGFSRQAPSLKPREAFALVSDTGDRVIAVMKGKNKFTAFRDGKPIWRGELKPRAKTMEAGGHTWTKEEATTPEIEQHTTLRYYHDALGTEIDNNLRLGRALDNAMFIEGLKQLPSLKDHAMPPGEAPPADWRTVSIPQLQGWHFSPRIADILSDFAGEGASHPAETLARAGRIMVSSLFWNPLPHILNILDHAVIQRGLSALVNPAAYWRGAQTAVQAWRDVSNLSPDYVKMVREGAGLMYPKVILRDFGEQALRAIGHQPEMAAVAKAWGYANPLEMVKRIYGFSRRNLWFWNDVIMMQAYHERAAIRGKPMTEVMRDVERHIPNYRIPDRVLGSHWIAQVLKSPAFIAFGRYDYARLASYGSMIKDLVGKGVPLRDRATALDQMAALAFTSIVVYPMVLDKVAQALTGNPNASVQRFGANTIPYLLYEYFEGKKDASGVVQSMFPETPITKLAQEWYSNRNMFSGSKLLESVHDVPHVVAQMFNPLYLTGQVSSGKLSPEQFMLQSLGVKSPTSEQLEHRREWRERERTEARRHEERRR